MIGMMKCKMGGTDCGSVKSASVTVKPNYKEHKTGYPQISDLKALMYAEGVCKVDTEESVLMPNVKAIAVGLSSGTPVAQSFQGDAPGLGGTALTIAGDGFGSGCGISGKMEDFGTISAESTCLGLTFSGGGGGGGGTMIGGVPFVQPVAASQAVTLDKNNLLFGAPLVNGDLCTQASFQASCKVRYLAMQWPPTLDAAIMESTDFSINGSFASGDAAALSDASANMVSGTVPTVKACNISVSTVGGGVCAISMDGIIEADVSFNPGNDWNGISIKMSAMLTDPSKVGTNWANIN
jgi:hypothetical protein